MPQSYSDPQLRLGSCCTSSFLGPQILTFSLHWVEDMWLWVPFYCFPFSWFPFFLMLLCHVTERASFIFLIPSSTFFMGLFSALRSPPHRWALMLFRPVCSLHIYCLRVSDRGCNRCISLPSSCVAPSHWFGPSPTGSAIAVMGLLFFFLFTFWHGEDPSGHICSNPCG